MAPMPQQSLTAVKGRHANTWQLINVHNDQKNIKQNSLSRWDECVKCTQNTKNDMLNLTYTVSTWTTLHVRWPVRVLWESKYSTWAYININMQTLFTMSIFITAGGYEMSTHPFKHAKFFVNNRNTRNTVTWLHKWTHHQISTQAFGWEATSIAYFGFATFANCSLQKCSKCVRLRFLCAALLPWLQGILQLSQSCSEASLISFLLPFSLISEGRPVLDNVLLHVTPNLYQPLPRLLYWSIPPWRFSVSS